MSTRAITLPEPLAAYVDERVRSGQSIDESHVVQKALRVLRAVETRRTAFEAAIQEGLDDLARGDFEKIDDLDAWFASIRSEWKA